MTLHDANVMIPLFVAVFILTAYLAALYVREVNRTGREQERNAR